MFALNRHDAIVASFHLIDGDEEGQGPKSLARSLANVLRKFYGVSQDMIFTHQCRSASTLVCCLIIAIGPKSVSQVLRACLNDLRLA